MTENSLIKALLNWRLQLVVLVTAVIAEFIGIIKIPMLGGSLLLLPLFYAFIFCLLLR